MNIEMRIGQCTPQQLKLLAEWLENAPLPLNPSELTTEIGIQDVRVIIKAKVSSPVVASKK